MISALGKWQGDIHIFHIDWTTFHAKRNNVWGLTCPDDGIPKILSLMVFVALHNSNPSITHFPILRWSLGAENLAAWQLSRALPLCKRKKRQAGLLWAGFYHHGLLPRRSHAPITIWARVRPPKMPVVSLTSVWNDWGGSLKWTKQRSSLDPP